jgi:hypothetical protein
MNSPLFFPIGELTLQKVRQSLGAQKAQKGESIL